MAVRLSEAGRYANANRWVAKEARQSSSPSQPVPLADDLTLSHNNRADFRDALSHEMAIIVPIEALPAYNEDHHFPWVRSDPCGMISVARNNGKKRTS